MHIPTIDNDPVNAPPEWRTEEYHGKLMHVRSALRVLDNAELTGHGQQWDFTVTITDEGAAPTEGAGVSATSDPGLYYSTQSIAVDMGFLKGRELIEGR